MHIEGKKISLNLFKGNLDSNNIQTDSIQNSIFVQPDNQAEKKREKDEKNEYLNARISQVKEYTINEFHKEIEKDASAYSNYTNMPDFDKAIDRYLTANLNSMVYYAAQNAINSGEDDYEAAVNILGKFLNGIKSLDGDKRQKFFTTIAGEAMKMYSKTNSKAQATVSGDSATTPTITYNTDKELSELEPDALDKSYSLMFLELIDQIDKTSQSLQEVADIFEYLCNVLETGDTTGLSKIMYQETEFTDLNYMRKWAKNIPEHINLDDYSKENLQKIYPEDKYTIVSSENRHELSNSSQSIEHIDVFDNKTGKIVFTVEHLKDNEQVVTIKTEKKDINGCTIYRTEYDSNGRLIDSCVDGIYSYIDRLRELLEENGRFWGDHSSIEELQNLIHQIDTDYVMEVLEEYEYDKTISAPQINGLLGTHLNEHPNSMIQDIFSMKKTPNSVKYDLAKHIIDKLVDKATIEDVDVSDLLTPLHEELEKQKNKYKMDNSEIDRYMRCIYLRIKDRMTDDKSINSKWIDYEHDGTPANGKIDEEFSQGSFGDCWLIAGIQSIVKNEKAKLLLEDCLEVRENGDIKVTLKGVDMSYIIPKNRLCDYDYAHGDKDVRAIEIAIEKYEKTIKGDLSGINGGNAYQFFNMLFGVEPDIIDLKLNDSWLDLILGEKSYIRKIKSGKYLTVGSVSEKTDKKAINEKGEEVELSYPHGYSITNTDDKYVYFTNPHDKEGTLKMTHDDFSEAFNHLCMAKVRKIKRNVKKFNSRHKNKLN